MRDRINALVKKREAFRPFAPVVAAEAAAKIFEINPGEEDTYSHMLYVTHVRNEYRDKLVSAGFEQVEIEPTRIYRVEDAREFLTEKGLDVDALAPKVDGKFMSAFVRATKAKSAKTTEGCCAPACCN